MTKTAVVQAQQRWEYQQVTRKTETALILELNQVGDAGWELVSVSYHKDLKSALGSDFSWTAFLKRPHAQGVNPTAAPAAKVEVNIPPPVKHGQVDPGETPETFEMETTS
ncbi:MAG: hypothetical protein ACYC35_11900 [Pirellulales bacterium]|jgi:hypothetical protein